MLALSVLALSVLAGVPVVLMLGRHPTLGKRIRPSPLCVAAEAERVTAEGVIGILGADPE